MTGLNPDQGRRDTAKEPVNPAARVAISSSAVNPSAAARQDQPADTADSVPVHNTCRYNDTGASAMPMTPFPGWMATLAAEPIAARLATAPARSAVLASSDATRLWLPRVPRMGPSDEMGWATGQSRPGGGYVDWFVRWSAPM